MKCVVGVRPPGFRGVVGPTASRTITKARWHVKTSFLAARPAAIPLGLQPHGLGFHPSQIRPWRGLRERNTVIHSSDGVDYVYLGGVRGEIIDLGQCGVATTS